ncbi:MAG TPA: hypothetical protein VNR60_07575 [Croceibacterium sp.]|nr:hypothetical protein [Croceibacterium sp.]
MLRHRTFASLAVVGLLAACGDGGAATATAATPTTVASFDLPVPGLYSVVQTGDAAGEDERCLNAEDIQAGRFAPSDSVPDEWTVETNRMSGGTIEVVARHPSGGRLSMIGGYGRESFVVDASIDLTVNGEKISHRSGLKGTFISPDCAEED